MNKIDNKFEEYCKYLESIGIKNNNFLLTSTIKKPIEEMNTTELLKEMHDNIYVFFREMYMVDGKNPFVITDGAAEMLFNIDYNIKMKNIGMPPNTLSCKPLVWLGYRQSGKSTFLKGLTAYAQFRLMYEMIHMEIPKCANAIVLISRDKNLNQNLCADVDDIIDNICTRFPVLDKLITPDNGIEIESFETLEDASYHFMEDQETGKIYDIFVDEYEFLRSKVTLSTIFDVLRNQINTDLNTMFFSTFNLHRNEIEHTEFLQRLFLFRKGNFDLTTFEYKTYQYDGILINDQVTNNHFVSMDEINYLVNGNRLPDTVIKSEYFLTN